VAENTTVASPAQNLADRANAQSSTGPVTLEGKSRPKRRHHGALPGGEFTKQTQSAAESDQAEITKQTQSEPAEPVQIARGAQCPCGSGNKYKRCCGKDAPPALVPRRLK